MYKTRNETRKLRKIENTIASNIIEYGTAAILLASRAIIGISNGPKIMETK